MVALAQHWNPTLLALELIMLASQLCQELNMLASKPTIGTLNVSPLELSMLASQLCQELNMLASQPTIGTLHVSPSLLLELCMLALAYC